MALVVTTADQETNMKKKSNVSAAGWLTAAVAATAHSGAYAVTHDGGLALGTAFYDVFCQSLEEK